MNSPSFESTPADCEAVQSQLSELADTGAPMTPELQTHLASCAKCALFAEHWLQGPPAVLTRSVPALLDTRLRERILDANTAPLNVVRFQQTLAATVRPPWTMWLGRIAACALLAGFSYWLLNPMPTQVRVTQLSTPEPTLVQSFTQMEDQTRNEQEVLHAAFLKGTRRVRGTMSRSMSALEL